MPLITENVRDDLCHFIWNKCKHSGLYLHRLGETENHIHMLVYIPPKFAVAEVIGQIKGASAFFVNRKLSDDELVLSLHGGKQCGLQRHCFFTTKNTGISL